MERNKFKEDILSKITRNEKEYNILYPDNELFSSEEIELYKNKKLENEESVEKIKDHIDEITRNYVVLGFNYYILLCILSGFKKKLNF
jgi:hypothetical protein